MSRQAVMRDPVVYELETAEKRLGWVLDSLQYVAGFMQQHGRVADAQSVVQTGIPHVKMLMDWVHALREQTGTFEPGWQKASVARETLRDPKQSE